MDIGWRVIDASRVEAARAEAIPAADLDRMSRIFKALGDSTRLGIVMALRGGEMCVCDLAASLAITESAASHQLRKLRDLALVRNRRQGQVLYYALDDDHIESLLNIGLEHSRE